MARDQTDCDAPPQLSTMLRRAAPLPRRATSTPRTPSRRLATASAPSIVAPNRLRSELKRGRVVSGCMVAEVRSPLF